MHTDAIAIAKRFEIITTLAWNILIIIACLIAAACVQFHLDNTSK